jgi:DNA-directed RNA polymerase specialized sigma24 family protein
MFLALSEKGLARSKTKCNTPTVYGVAVGKHYEQLKPEERATVMLMNREGSSIRAMSRALKRSPSTISREINRHRSYAQKLWMSS